MSEGIICDGCKEPIDTEREQWIEIKVTHEKDRMIAESEDIFPVEEKKLHFHAKKSNSEKLSRNCAEEQISKDSLARKVIK